MRFAMVHQFHGVTRERFIEIFFDAKLNAWFRQDLDLGRYEVQSQVEVDGEIRRVTWTRLPRRYVPRSVLRATRSSRLMIREEARHRLGSSVIRFQVRPNVLRRSVRSKGRIELEERDGGLLRKISGRIDVDVPLIGDSIADVVHDNLERVNRSIAKRMQQWIDNHPA